MTASVSKLLPHPAAITPDELSALGAALGMSGDEVVATLGLARETLDDWLNGAARLPSFEEDAIYARLGQLRALSPRLQDTFQPTGGGRWLRQESRILENAKPMTLLLHGQFERINDALEAMDAEVFI